MSRHCACCVKNSADLDRLAGPVCPRDQRRAVEHEIAASGWLFISDDGRRYVAMKLDGERHPAWPAGKKWLRRHEGRYE